MFVRLLPLFLLLALSTAACDMLTNPAEWTKRNIMRRYGTLTGQEAAGRDLFISHTCFNCHKLEGQDVVGPLLKGVTTRHSREWIRQWIMDPNGMWKGDHPETLKLKQWRPGKAELPNTIMKVEPPLTADEADAVIAFLAANDRME